VKENGWTPEREILSNVVDEEFGSASFLVMLSSLFHHAVDELYSLNYFHDKLWFV
jgi:hypothetical protein